MKEVTIIEYCLEELEILPPQYHITITVPWYIYRPILLLCFFLWVYNRKFF